MASIWGTEEPRFGEISRLGCWCECELSSVVVVEWCTNRRCDLLFQIVERHGYTLLSSDYHTDYLSSVDLRYFNGSIAGWIEDVGIYRYCGQLRMWGALLFITGTAECGLPALVPATLRCFMYGKVCESLSATNDMWRSKTGNNAKWWCVFLADVRCDVGPFMSGFGCYVVLSSLFIKELRGSFHNSHAMMFSRNDSTFDLLPLTTRR